MRCLSPCAAANGDQPPGLQGAQAVADIAFISPERLDQFEVIGADAPLSALMLGPHTMEDLALQFRKASCRHQFPLDPGAAKRRG